MSEVFHNYKTFFEAYESINRDHRVFKTYFKDKRLTISEKQLLQALMQMKKSKFDEVFKILSDIKSQDTFVLAMKYFLLGYTFYFDGRYLKSAQQLIKSLNLFETIKADNFTIKPISVLSHVYFAICDLQRLEKYYQVFLDLNLNAVKKDLVDLEYQIYISYLKNEEAKCFKLIDKVCETQINHIKLNLPNFELLKFALFVKNEKFDEAYESYHKYKALNGYKLISNKTFIVTLLNHITKNEKVYAYKKDFKDSDHLYYQLKLIRAFTLKNKEDCVEIWEKLKSFSPDLYGERYQYNGQKGLFSIALDKHTKSSEVCDSNSHFDIDEAELATKKTTSAKLDYILKNSPSHITKDELIYLVWGEEWTPENDNRLRTLIYRYKKKHQCQIDVVDGKYKLAA